MSERFLIVGLGNPGKEYEDTRHNIGFRCVDALAQKHGLSYERKKASKTRVASGTIGGRAVLLAKPQTYMNRSGSAVQGLAAFYKIPSKHIMIVFDDLDIPPGTLRIRPKGGTGGHKGMTDIVRRLGTKDIPRIRFGIGRPPDQMDPAAYVLRRFDASELDLVNEAISRTVEAIETWLREGIDTAMNYYNGTAEDVAARFAPPTETEQSTTPTQPNDQTSG